MREGSIVAQRFEIQHEAGSGGMGTVYRAVDLREGGTLALKILHGRDPIDAQRLEREAAILASLSHPGVVRYVDHGTAESGAPYLAMEWIDGVDLATRLMQGRLTLVESGTLIRQAADALAHAHARGLVHRDIKPSN